MKHCERQWRGGEDSCSGTCWLHCNLVFSCLLTCKIFTQTRIYFEKNHKFTNTTTHSPWASSHHLQAELPLGKNKQKSVQYLCGIKKNKHVITLKAPSVQKWLEFKCAFLKPHSQLTRNKQTNIVHINNRECMWQSARAVVMVRGG